jgi:hypothetical protein
MTQRRERSGTTVRGDRREPKVRSGPQFIPREPVAASHTRGTGQ